MMNKLLAITVLILSSSTIFAADRTLMDTSAINETLEAQQYALVMDKLSQSDINEMLSTANNYDGYNLEFVSFQKMRVNEYIQHIAQRAWEYRQVLQANQIMEDETRRITSELHDNITPAAYWL
jgi:hypothetical protein